MYNIKTNVKIASSFNFILVLVVRFCGSQSRSAATSRFLVEAGTYTLSFCKFTGGAKVKTGFLAARQAICTAAQ